MKAKKWISGLLAICLLNACFDEAALADSVTVTADRLNIRKEADASSKSVGMVNRGDELSFVSGSEGWYQVRFDGKTGFVAEDYVKLDRSAMKEDVAENTEAFSGVGTAVERVNKRELPESKASIVKVVPKQGKVEVTGRCGEWYRVKYDGKTGYMMAKYVTLKSGAEATAEPEATKAPAQNDSLYGEPISGVVTVRVNMRAEASKDSAILRVLAVGETISIIGETGDWYCVYAGGKQGYIVKTCAEPVSAGENVRPTATPKPTAAPTAAPTVKPEETDQDDVYDQTKTGTTTARVNMRKTPSASAKIVMVVAKGAKVTVEGENGDWYKVSVSGKSGYISGSYLTVSDQRPEATAKPTAAPTVKPTSAPTPTAKPSGDTVYSEAKTGRTTARLNMRAEASTGSAVVTVIPSGAKAALLGEKGSFYHAQYDGRKGYISKAYVEIVAGEASRPEEDKKDEEVKDTLYSKEKDGITTARVNMRRVPEGDILHTLAADTRIILLGESGGWYKVKYANSTGYISKSYAREYKAQEEDKTSGEGTKGYITAASVNMRKGPGTGYGVIKVLKRGAEIRYYELKDGWYLIKAGSDTGYVSSNYVSKSEPEPESGGSSGESGSTGKVILSDWFKGEIADVFARGDEATVTDVKTGLKFKATRTGGYYHADAQPSTSSDTKIMYKIYGNEWQWTRRAIWVTVDGKTYAASMNGMPHGETDVITGNNFDGCFCIHFLNSKTHAGDRVDSAHQDCVQEAYKAGK